MKQTYAEASATLIGRDLTINGIRHTVTKYSPRFGKLKDGSEASYVIVTSALGNEVNLHPRTVKELFTKGEAVGIKLLVDTIATQATVNDKPLSKKQQAINIFNEAVALKETRQYVIKRIMSETSSSLNLANTYYQGIKSGNYK